MYITVTTLFFYININLNYNGCRVVIEKNKNDHSHPVLQQFTCSYDHLTYFTDLPPLNLYFFFKIIMLVAFSCKYHPNNWFILVSYEKKIWQP